MRKTPFTFFTISTLLLAIILLSSCQDKKINLFVAPNGSDMEGKGTIEQPFATLERARDEIRELKTEGSADKRFQVNLREGTYFRNDAFELIEEDSGTDGCPVVYSSYQDEKVIIHGGINIPVETAQNVTDQNILSRFNSTVRNEILEIDLKALGITDFGNLHPVGFARPYGPAWAELFINGEPCTLARWPNDSTVTMGKIIDSGSIPRDGDFTKRGGVFTFDSDRPLTWKSHHDIWISGYFQHGWAEDAVELAQIDTINKTLTTKQPTLYGFGTGQNFNRWFAYNILEEVDRPGEYYIDREDGKLYFFSSDALLTLEISMQERPLVSIKGASNIHFNGLSFDCSRGMGVYMERGNNNLVSNCTFQNLGIVAVCMGKGIAPFADLMHEGPGEPASEIIGSYAQHQYSNTVFNREAGHNNGVLNCTIFNTGAGGIHLSGGDRLTLEPGNNYVENCRIHDFNRIEKSYRAAIDISGVGNRISHCELYNAPSMAILLHGNNHLIEFNNIHHVCQVVHDQGALYYGRDPSERGHKVSYNFFHHLDSKHLTAAVYHDDGACGMEVFGNVFYKAGSKPVLIGGGMDNSYTNNIFIDSELAIHVDNRNQNWASSTLDSGGIYDQRLKMVNYNQPPYSEKYPNLAKYWDDNSSLPKRNPVSKNIFYKVKQPYEGNKDWMPFLDDNWITDENPGFVDEKNMNFKLTKTAKAFSEIPGFEDIPFEKMGIVNQ
ncbi:MAG: right-handed parallel beta-helix repeat-containing protein [Bacteroidales bacterium]|nr:right-handed parallel beta-helix repeat-containing protein [Bacteroidales bacterium]MCF8458052.1 right-handed parallel beta-helix repeat-containing protein [Bacteroidales bacterium]